MLSCRITQLRRRAGINQIQLAEELHLSPSTIGMYEQGRRTPNIEILIQMARFYNVSLDYLLTGSEYTPSSENKNMTQPPPACLCHNCCCREILEYLRGTGLSEQQRPK